MLIKENRYDEYAYRVATFELADATATLHEGSWVHLNSDGKIAAADGTLKPFLCLTSNRTSRDNVTPQGYSHKASILWGKAIVTVCNDDGEVAYDDDVTYTVMAPLKVVKDSTTGQGIVTLWTAPTYTVNETTHAVTVGGDGYDEIVGYALGAADATSKTLRIATL